MNQQTRSFLFGISGLLLLTGAVLHFVELYFAPYLFAFGAAGIAISYLTLPAKNMDFRQRRLHKYNIVASLLMIFASGLMFSGHKEWVICLTIAAILQIYTAFTSTAKKE